MIHQFQSIIGPLWTSLGFRYWNLLLAPEGIVAWPYTTREAFALSVRRFFGFPRDPAGNVRSHVGHGPIPWELLRSDRSRFIPRSAIGAVGVELRWGQNVVVVKLASGGKRVFQVSYREHTFLYRSALRSVFPDIYFERGFDQGLISKVKNL